MPSSTMPQATTEAFMRPFATRHSLDTLGFSYSEAAPAASSHKASAGQGIDVPTPEELTSLKERLLTQAHALVGAQNQQELLEEMAELYEAFSSLQALLFVTEGDLKQTRAAKSQRS